MTLNDPYVPVYHASWADHWRVPMWVEGDTYRISIGRNTYRNFTDETLPKEVKSIIAMVNAYPSKDIPIWEVDPTNAFINKQDPALNTIGWRVSRYLYILILSKEFIGELHGDHPRRQG